MRLIRLLKNEIVREAEEQVEENIISQSQGDKFFESFDEDYHLSKSYESGFNALIGL